MENKLPFWVSSEGQGVAQRIVSFVLLLLPIASQFGLHILPQDVQTVSDAVLIIGFGIWHGWAWIRAHKNKKFGRGKFAK